MVETKNLFFFRILSLLGVVNKLNRGKVIEKHRLSTPSDTHNIMFFSTPFQNKNARGKGGSGARRCFRLRAPNAYLYLTSPSPKQPSGLLLSS